MKIKLLKTAQCCKFNPDAGLTCTYFDKGTVFEVDTSSGDCTNPHAWWGTRDGWIFRAHDAYCCDD